MAGRIVVFGATGYTGELVARSLIARGESPVLAARSPERLAVLADALGGAETRVADISRPETVRALVERGDVLISTVGPFARWGAPAAEAAIHAGAHYFDTTGEPAFIRRVFEEYGPRAKSAGCTMLTAFGFDWVPGNLAGALALTAAGDRASSVDIGYFSRGGGGISGGTAASTLGVIIERSFRLRRGRVRAERTGARARAFELKPGHYKHGISVGGSEHYGLSALYPSLSDVDVYLGRPGKFVAATPVLTGVLAAVTSVPPLRTALASAVHKRGGGSTGGPDERRRAEGSCTVIAEARSADGRLLHRTRLDGPNGYTFTADIMAWGAITASQKSFGDSGALGPVGAFGLTGLLDGAAGVGLRESTETLRG